MIYKDLNKFWLDTLFNINAQGHKLNSRDGYCQEILGFHATLTYPLHNILFIPKRNFSLSYACAEMLWYLSGTGNIDMIQAYASKYEKFAENGQAYGAYGQRWANNPGFIKEKVSLEHDEDYWDDAGFDITTNQLSALIHLLKTDPDTRQAVMTMWDSGDLIHAITKDHKDIPCTLSLIFVVRDNKLYLITTMRSNDAWLGLPYDIFCFTTLQRIVALELGLELGSYIHQAGSEHIYERNQEKIEEIFYMDDKGVGTIPLYPYPLGWNYRQKNYNLQHNIKQALAMEREIRKTATLGAVYGAAEKRLTDMVEKKRQAWINVDPLFKDLALGCATRWIHVPSEWFDNPLYADCQRYMEMINEQA